MVNIGNSWDKLLSEEFQKDYYLALRSFLATEYRQYTVYPDMYSIFKAFKLTPYEDVKVVILGQDPYHEEGQAEGLAFSVPDGIQKPPSLRNIFKELQDDIGINISTESGSLAGWARQGVFLLNTSLTVRKGQANSHSGKGWELLTDKVVALLSQREKPMVFILWGRNARSKVSIIDTSRHCIIQSAHPSPLSAFNGFFGSKPFSKANEFLSKVGEVPIDWSKTE